MSVTPLSVRAVQLCALLLLPLLPYTVEADTYRHVDENGQVTFSDAPMRNGQIVRTRYHNDSFRKGAGASCANFHEASLDERARQWWPAMQEAGARYHIEPTLLLAVARVESCFDTRAESRAGARGLMQLMPTTAAELHVEDRWNGQQNLDGGARYLARMLALHDNRLDLALAAYNAGPGNVLKHGGIPPFAETQRYIERVMATEARYRELQLSRN